MLDTHSPVVQSHHMRYVRLYNDEDLVTRFEDREFHFAPADFAPPAPPVDVSAPTSASAVMMLRFPAGWSDPMHPAPARQWMYLLVGEASITAGGETRRFSPGAVLLVEDTEGPGHASEMITDTLVAVVRT